MEGSRSSQLSYSRLMVSVSALAPKTTRARLHREPLCSEKDACGAPEQSIPLRWWGEEDSNLRRHEPTDLQSAPFDHSGISPCGENRIRLDGSPAALALNGEGVTFIMRNAVLCQVATSTARTRSASGGHSHLSDLNREPRDYKSRALPVELRWRVENCYAMPAPAESQESRICPRANR